MRYAPAFQQLDDLGNGPGRRTAYQGDRPVLTLDARDAGQGQEFLFQRLGNRVVRLDLNDSLPMTRKQFFHRSCSDHLSLVHDGDLFAEMLHFFHIMARIEDGHPVGVHLLQAFIDEVPGLGVYADGGLVKEKDPRAVNEPDSQAQAALQPAGEGMDAPVRQVLHVGYGKAAVDAAVRSAPRRPCILPKKERFSRAVSVGYKAMSWGTYPIIPLISVKPSLIEMPETKTCRIGREQRAQDRQRRRLSCAVGSEQAEEAAFADGKGYPIHGWPVGPGYLFETDESSICFRDHSSQQIQPQLRCVGEGEH